MPGLLHFIVIGTTNSFCRIPVDNLYPSQKADSSILGKNDNFVEGGRKEQVYSPARVRWHWNGRSDKDGNAIRRRFLEDIQMFQPWRKKVEPQEGSTAVTEGLYLTRTFYRCIEKVKRVTQEWSWYYNNERPYESLDNMPPMESLVKRCDTQCLMFRLTNLAQVPSLARSRQAPIGRPCTTQQLTLKWTIWNQSPNYKSN